MFIQLSTRGLRVVSLPRRNNLNAIERSLKIWLESLISRYTTFGSAISTASEDSPTAGTLMLTEAWGAPLEPAPIAPFGEDSAPWQLSSGTIKATFNAHRGLDGADNIFRTSWNRDRKHGWVVLLLSGIRAEVDDLSTDTRYYWNLTRHIIRYNHRDGGKGLRTPNGVHTVNERMFGNPFRSLGFQIAGMLGRHASL